MGKKYNMKSICFLFLSYLAESNSVSVPSMAIRLLQTPEPIWKPPRFDLCSGRPVKAHSLSQHLSTIFALSSAFIGAISMLIWLPYQFLLSPAYLDESNIGCLLSETLTTDIETVFSNQTRFMGAHTTNRGSVSPLIDACPNEIHCISSW